MVEIIVIIICVCVHRNTVWWARSGSIYSSSQMNTAFAELTIFKWIYMVKNKWLKKQVNQPETFCMPHPSIKTLTLIRMYQVRVQIRIRFRVRIRVRGKCHPLYASFLIQAICLPCNFYPHLTTPLNNLDFKTAQSRFYRFFPN